MCVPGRFFIESPSILDNVNLCVIPSAKSTPTNTQHAYETWKTWISFGFCKLYVVASNPHRLFDLRLLVFVRHTFSFFIYHHSFKSKDGIYFNEFHEHFFRRTIFFCDGLDFSQPTKIVIMLLEMGTDGTCAGFTKFKTECWIYVLDELSAIKNKIQTNEKHWTQYITVISSIFLVGHCAFFNQRIAKSFPGTRANK